MTHAKMHSHIFKFLPQNYCSKAKEILEKQGADYHVSTIYSVKSGRRKNNQIFLVLLQIENENKKLLDSIEAALTGNN